MSKNEKCGFCIRENATIIHKAIGGVKEFNSAKAEFEFIPICLSHVTRKAEIAIEKEEEDLNEEK